MKLPAHIQYWDDERNIDNGIIVTLHYGYSFEEKEHAGVRGFDTIKEAKLGTKKSEVYSCNCETCNKNKPANK